MEEHLSAGRDPGDAVPHPSLGSAPHCPQEPSGSLGCSKKLLQVSHEGLQLCLTSPFLKFSFQACTIESPDKNRKLHQSGRESSAGMRRNAPERPK